MAISSVPPPGGHAIGQQSLISLAQRKNGIGHGHVTSGINVQNSNSSQNAAPAAGNSTNTVGTNTIGSKLNKLV